MDSGQSGRDSCMHMSQLDFENIVSVHVRGSLRRVLSEYEIPLQIFNNSEFLLKLHQGLYH